MRPWNFSFRPYIRRWWRTCSTWCWRERLHCTAQCYKLTQWILRNRWRTDLTSMGGRIVRYLMVTIDPCVRMTNRNSNYKVCLDNTDSVLHWPQCNMPQSRRTGAMWDGYLIHLPWICLRRAHDQYYIDLTISWSAEYGHVLLLEFSYSIGVKIY